MNRNITMLITSDIHSQQNLNTPKEELRITHRPTVDFSFGEWFVEKPLRKYNTVYKDIKLSIHQINVFPTIINPTIILNQLKDWNMNIQDAKQIKIADYLQSLGYSPVKQQSGSLWYKSPFRRETEASFKVNTDRNLWFDYDAPI